MRFCIKFLAKDQSVTPDDIRGKLAISHPTIAPHCCDTTNAFIGLHQVHGIAGTDVTYDNLAALIPAGITDGDYLVTRLTDVTLSILTADCMAILIIDPVRNVIAAVHAGWRGSTQGVIKEAIACMQQEYGTQITDLELYIGPSARMCCYEVDEPFIKSAGITNRDVPYLQECNGQLFFDNPTFAVEQLLALGIQRQQIDLSSTHCTICSDMYCSYRREPQLPHRQLSLICMHQ